MRQIIIFCFIISTVISCSSLEQLAQNKISKVPDNIYYKNDICVYDSINKKSFCGVGVLPYQKTYKLKIEAKAKLNFFAMTTCHREDTTENPDKGIFRKNGRTFITYTPTLEQKKACPLHLAAFNKKGKNSWGIIFFENPRFDLKAKLICNGETKIFNGVSVCQSRQGLTQRIIFSEKVETVNPVGGASKSEKGCPSLNTTDNKIFTFRVPPKECIYGFIGIKTKKIHQLNTIGYEKLIIRE